MDYSTAIWLILAGGLTLTGAGFYYGRSRRQRKNYQRGLEMIVLQIHLPPPGESANQQRDQREIIDENISKAHILYNVLASIDYQKNLKARYFGQQHFGFEIIADDKIVTFYAVAPDSLAGIIKQAVVSAYPTARVEQVSDHNLFNQSAPSAGIVGATIGLKDHFSQPIATYVDTKQDTMKSILQALINLDQGLGVGLQILIRPAKSNWVDQSRQLAQEKTSGDKKESLTKLVGQALKADDGQQSAKTDQPAKISTSDQELAKAIESKIGHPGFEVLIRLLISGPDQTVSNNLYHNLTASLALFNKPGSNSFSIKAAKSIKKLVTDFNLRIFPATDNQTILNTVELASLFHLPDQTNTSISQVGRQLSKQVDGPRNLPESGLMLGHNVFRDIRRPVFVGINDRMRHMYIVGQTGSGKSVLLENLIAQDIADGRGFAIVDPHGETTDTILAQIPDSRLDDVVYFNPGNMDYPSGLNIFEHDDPGRQDFLIQEGISMLYKLYDPQRQGIIGPRYEYMFRNAAKLIMAGPDGGTLIDIPKLFNHRSFVNQKLKHVKDKTVLDFWQKEVPASERSQEFGEVKSWFISKFSAFLGNDMMRNIIGQTKSSFDMSQIMDEGKIFIVNLSKGLTGELNSSLLGMILVTKFQIAALARAKRPSSDRPDFILYVDEFQNFATDSFASILSEARKYRLGLVVANQHTSQLSDEVRESILGNIGTAITFRVSANDAEHMVKQFFNPTFEIDDLTRLPLGNTVVRTMVQGTPTTPFSLETQAPQPTDHNRKKQIEATINNRQGRPRAEVEKEIFKRLEVKEDPLPPRPGSISGLTGPGAVGPLPAGLNPPPLPGVSPNPAKIPGYNPQMIQQKQQELLARIQQIRAAGKARKAPGDPKPETETDLAAGWQKYQKLKSKPD